VVIGGGMTAIDAAVQSKAAGRRGGDHRLPPRKERMNASLYEQELARPKGVRHPHWMKAVSR
jgi:dihydropyrimidine dehydrogenase (NAD+) subunit PreT